jgi:hypothetical protein
MLSTKKKKMLIPLFNECPFHKDLSSEWEAIFGFALFKDFIMPFDYPRELVMPQKIN